MVPVCTVHGFVRCTRLDQAAQLFSVLFCDPDFSLALQERLKTMSRFFSDFQGVKK
jgi:hypothetical protein